MDGCTDEDDEEGGGGSVSSSNGGGSNGLGINDGGAGLKNGSLNHQNNGGHHLSHHQLGQNGKRRVPKVFSKDAITKFRSWLFQNLTVRNKFIQYQKLAHKI